jgi:hypothetical protein
MYTLKFIVNKLIIFCMFTSISIYNDALAIIGTVVIFSRAQPIVSDIEPENAIVCGVSLYDDALASKAKFILFL